MGDVNSVWTHQEGKSMSPRGHTQLCDCLEKRWGGEQKGVRSHESGTCAQCKGKWSLLMQHVNRCGLSLVLLSQSIRYQGHRLLQNTLKNVRKDNVTCTTSCFR